MFGNRLLFLIFFASCTNLTLFGQIIKTDTTNTRLYFNLYDFESGNDTLYKSDTTLDGFHQKHTLYNNYSGVQQLGMNGTAARPLEILGGTGYFNEGAIAYDVWRFKQNPQINISGKPVSDLHYAQGYGSLIYVNAHHAQPLGKYASFGVDFRRVKMQNIYYGNLPKLDRTRIPNIYNTRLFFRLDPPEGRYLLLVQLTSNRINNVETGGMLSKGDFDSLSRRARQFNATAVFPEANNIFRDFDIQANQIFKINRKNDSLAGVKSRLYHELYLAKHKNYFNGTGQDSGIYPNPVYAANTTDSQLYHYIVNRFGLSIFNKRQTLKLGIKQQSVWAKMLKGGPIAYTTLFAEGKYRLAFKKSITEADAAIGFGGFNNGDIYLNGRQQIFFKEHLQFYAGLNALLYEPGYAVKYYNSNLYNWDLKTGDKQQELRITAGLTSGKNNVLSLEGSTLTRKNNYVFNALNAPVFTQQSVTVVKIKAQIKGNLRWLHLNGTAVWQQSSDQHILPVPAFIVNSSLFADGKLFSKNLWFQAGVQLLYNTSFQAMMYNPVLRQFSISNQGNFGNLPQTDVFIDCRVRTLSFMLRYQQINQLINPTQSIIVNPIYPNLPNSLSIGLRWWLTN